MSEAGPVNGINTYNEKSLHADLKQWYALPGDKMEVRVDGYIIDLVRGDLLIEIQTGGFSPLKRKLAHLAQAHPVRLVFSGGTGEVDHSPAHCRKPEATAAQIAQARASRTGFSAACIHPGPARKREFLAGSADDPRGRSSPF